jgi:hypothetical protein
MSGPDVERIAAGLTEAQRRAVLYMPGEVGFHPLYGNTVMCLSHKGIVSREIRQNSPILDDQSIFANLTPLGLAVRAHLERKNNEID